MTGRFDPYLNVIVGLLANEGRLPIHRTLLEEPVFLRIVRKWVNQAIETRKKMDAEKDKLRASSLGGIG